MKSNFGDPHPISTKLMNSLISVIRNRPLRLLRAVQLSERLVVEGRVAGRCGRGWSACCPRGYGSLMLVSLVVIAGFRLRSPCGLRGFRYRGFSFPRYCAHPFPSKDLLLL